MVAMVISSVMEALVRWNTSDHLLLPGALCASFAEPSSA
jgi:hypothetical protein